MNKALQCILHKKLSMPQKNLSEYICGRNIRGSNKCHWHVRVSSCFGI